MVIFLLLSRMNSKKMQKRFPVLKRIDYTLSILAWVLLLSAVLTLLYWIYTQIIK